MNPLSRNIEGATIAAATAGESDTLCAADIIARVIAAFITEGVVINKLSCLLSSLVETYLPLLLAMAGVVV